jgi:hypothetical protein
VSRPTSENNTQVGSVTVIPTYLVGAFSGFPQSLQVYAGFVPEIRQRPLAPTVPPNGGIYAFDAVCSC